MRYIFVFVLIVACGASDKKRAYAEDFFCHYHSKSYKAWKNSDVSLASLIFWPENNSSDGTQEISPPEIKILLSQKNQQFFEWNEYVRYSIDLSDTIDGATKYGEIDDSDVVLETEFLPIGEGEKLSKNEVKDKIKITEKEPEHLGLSLMKNSTCFGCHADKAKHTGPSFANIADKYEYSSSNISSIASSILEGSKGIWGSTEMPSNPDLTISETEQIATFILNQGVKKNSWILPGLEGTFRIIEKPKNAEKGFYILTASYTSTSKMRGQHTIMLNIR